MLYLDLVEGPTLSITCCERPVTLMEPSAGAGGNVVRQVVDVDVDGCQWCIMRAPIDWWILKVERKNHRRSGYPSPTPGSHCALHQVVLATFAHQTGHLLHVGRPLLVGHRLAGRVRESHSRCQQLLVELLLADVRREGQKVVAEIIGNDLQGDGLDEVVPEVVLIDLRDELDDS